jgi:cation transport regulator
LPYETNADLPESLQRLLPTHAQDIFRAAFNHAYAAHADDPRREEAARRIAWAAVKRSYVKTAARWRPREHG